MNSSGLSDNSDHLSANERSSLFSIGWDDQRSAQFEQWSETGHHPGRVVRVDGRSVLVSSDLGTRPAETATSLARNAETTQALPAVGDWVVLTPRPSHETDLIESVLERRTSLERTRQVMNSAVEHQVLAANIDVILIVHAANNLNLRRLEREAVQAASSGAQIVVVLNKADLVWDIDELLSQVQTSIPSVPVHAASGAIGDGVSDLAAYARPNRTAVFLGASGVGKSTLTNRILGRTEMETSEVREDDQRGRHTTTARHLIPVPGGGALIDTPGIRSIGLSGAADGVATVFDDITELEAECRFSDCSHSGEPGCAIADAINSGDLAEERYNSFNKMQRELEFIQSKSDVRLRHAKRDMLKARTKRGRQQHKARNRFGRPD